MEWREIIDFVLNTLRCSRLGRFFFLRGVLMACWGSPKRPGVPRFPGSWKLLWPSTPRFWAKNSLHPSVSHGMRRFLAPQAKPWGWKGCSPFSPTTEECPTIFVIGGMGFSPHAYPAIELPILTNLSLLRVHTRLELVDPRLHAQHRSPGGSEVSGSAWQGVEGRK